MINSNLVKNKNYNKSNSPEKINKIHLENNHQIDSVRSAIKTKRVTNDEDIKPDKIETLNVIEGLSDKIRVWVRIRPPINTEIAKEINVHQDFDNSSKI